MTPEKIFELYWNGLIPVNVELMAKKAGFLVLPLLKDEYKNKKDLKGVFEITPDNYKIIGYLPSLTEEDRRELVAEAFLFSFKNEVRKGEIYYFSDLESKDKDFLKILITDTLLKFIIATDKKEIHDIYSYCSDILKVNTSSVILRMKKIGYNIF